MCLYVAKYYTASNICMNMYGASKIIIHGAYNICMNIYAASNICMNLYGASNMCMIM